MFRSALIAATSFCLLAAPALAQSSASSAPSDAPPHHHHRHKKHQDDSTTEASATSAHRPSHHHGTTSATEPALATVAPPHRHRHHVELAEAAPPAPMPHSHHHARHIAVAAAAIAAGTAVAAAAPAPPAAPVPDLAKGSDSGLPIPRFAALRSDEVSLRAGPGTQYPIEWVYQRRYLPVKIEREFEVWRLVSEPDGTEGWIHQAMLTGRRGFLIDGDQPQTMRANADPNAAAVAILQPGVVGRLLGCPTTSADWCQVEAQTYKGWLPRTAFFGTLQGETVSE